MAKSQAKATIGYLGTQRKRILIWAVAASDAGEDYENDV
jgi:hypothetical protein